MVYFPILSSLIAIPLIGMLLIFFFINDKIAIFKNNIFSMAFWTSIFAFILSLFLLINFNFQHSGFQFVENFKWLDTYNINFNLGIDGISIFFIILTTALVPICIVASKDSIKHRSKEFMINFLLLESLVIAVFSVTDIFLFYVFLELSLVPMFLIIGIWGGKRRVYASFKFFLYTFLGSVMFLLAIIYIYIKTGTTDVIYLANHLSDILSFKEQKILWLAFFVSFAVKLPMFPFHTWLPDAHVEAPTAGSVMLAAILLKIGGYGFIRFSLPLLPDASLYFKDLVFVLSIIAIIYTSIVALMQEDIKKLVAYSSVAHMGFVTLGIFSFNQTAISGAIFQMISHGIIAAALFLSVGVIYDRMKTREISKYSGLAAQMPKYAILFMVFCLGSVALPGTNSFIGEFLILVGNFQVSVVAAMFAASAAVLGAIYMLWLTRNIFMGEIQNKDILQMQDINKREMVYLSLLAVMVIIFGLYPMFILDYLNISVNDLVSIF
jgi:NADH-quinone oxidoreductase subunit M